MGRMAAKRSHFAEALALAVLTAIPGFTANLDTLSGSIAGFVRDNAGLPQMGATVSLMNRYERVIARAITNERGIFGFGSLPPDLYSVRVSMPSFVPAMRQRISVQPGMQSLLYVNMASVLSSIELVYAAPGQGALMSDDWRWTLKESAATRPILRALPDLRDPAEKKAPKQVFSDTRGLVSLSGGDGGAISTDAMQSDLGTAFALATSVFGRNQVQLSGNVGFSARTGLPIAGFRTTYSRDQEGPQVTVTVRQIYLPTRVGAALAPGPGDGMPAMRSISVATIDQLQLTDNLRLQYGGSMDTISYLDQLNHFSPFARLMYELGALGEVQLAFSAGAPPVELLGSHDAAGEETGLREDLALLSVMPQISMRNQQLELQRSESYEIGYKKHMGSRTVSLSAFRDTVSNAALLMSNAPATFGSADLLPDISSDAEVFNVGRFERRGYSASVTQALGDKIEVTGAVGRAGALSANGLGDSPEALRGSLNMDERYWASARASATLPGSGTRIVTSYQWTDGNALMPAHFYMTQTTWTQPGLNIEVRQPIPSFFGMPGRLEATAGLQNILAQGYLTVPGGSGQQVLLTQSPRAVRGGLAFTF